MNFFFQFFTFITIRIFLISIKILKLSIFLIKRTLSIKKFKKRYLINEFLLIIKYYK